MNNHFVIQKKRFLFSIFVLFLISFCLSSSIGSVKAHKSSTTDNKYFKVTPGEIYVYNIEMTSKNWTVEVLYNEYYDVNNEFYKLDQEIVLYSFLDTDKEVCVEYIKKDQTVHGNLCFGDRIEVARDLQWFFALKTYVLEYMDDSQNRTVVEDEKKNQVKIMEERGPLSINRTYNLNSYTLTNYHSYNHNTTESFSLTLKTRGDGLFGIYPTDTTLISFFLYGGLFLIALSITLRFLPETKTYEKFKIDNSIFQSLWMKTMFFDTIAALKAFKERKFYYMFELITLTAIALISGTLYRVIFYACNTLGIIHLFSLFLPFFLVVVIKMLIWVIPAIIIAYVLQYRKENEKNISSLKTVSLSIIYIYSVYESVYFLLSWAVTFKTDQAAADATYFPPFFYYGSVTKSLSPLTLFISNVLLEVGWIALLVWAAISFIMTFYKFSIPKKRFVYYIDEIVHEYFQSFVLTVILGGIWALIVFGCDLFLLPILVNILI